MDQWETISIVLNTCSAGSKAITQVSGCQKSTFAEIDQEMRSLRECGWELVRVNSRPVSTGIDKTAYDFRRILPA